MALDFLSTPSESNFYLSGSLLTKHWSASSVDAECTFSGGHVQVGHLQHEISSQTFKAQMAVSLWMGTPLLPDISHPTTILDTWIAQKGKESLGSSLEGPGSASIADTTASGSK
jgi:hypothetical protein